MIKMIAMKMRKQGGVLACLFSFLLLLAVSALPAAQAADVLLNATFDDAKLDYDTMFKYTGFIGGVTKPCSSGSAQAQADENTFEGGCMFMFLDGGDKDEDEHEFIHTFQLEKAQSVMIMFQYVIATEGFGASVKLQLDDEPDKLYQIYEQAERPGGAYARRNTVSSGVRSVAMEVDGLVAGKHTLSIIGSVDRGDARLYVDRVVLKATETPPAALEAHDSAGAGDTPLYSDCKGRVKAMDDGQVMPFPTAVSVDIIASSEDGSTITVELEQAFKGNDVDQIDCDGAIADDVAVKTITAIESYNWCRGYTMLCEREKFTRTVPCDKETNIATLTTRVFDNRYAPPVAMGDLCTNDFTLDVRRLRRQTFLLYDFVIPCSADCTAPSTNVREINAPPPTGEPTATPSAAPTGAPTKMPTQPPTAAPVVNTSPVLIDTGFETGLDGFTFVRDTFRNSKNPSYANPFTRGNGGFNSGNSVGVKLGGVDGINVRGMSAGYQKIVAVPREGKATLTFQYQVQNMDLDGGDRPEAQAIVSVDQMLYVLPAPNKEATWQPYSIDLDLKPGQRTVTLGGYLLIKEYDHQYAYIKYDDIRLAYKSSTRRLGSGQRRIPSNPTLLDAGFVDGPKRFVYIQDAFQESDDAKHDSNEAGGWLNDFEVQNFPTDARVEVWYRSTKGECANTQGVTQMLLKVDDRHAELVDVIDGSTHPSKGWQIATLFVSNLQTGIHRLTIGSVPSQEYSVRSCRSFEFGRVSVARK